MQVFLIQNVNKVGNAGDLVSVKDGYGRNFLIPRGLAVPVTQGTQKQIEQQKKQLTLTAQREEKKAVELKDRIEKIALSIPVQAGKDQKLFGAVTSQAIQERLKQQGVTIDRKKIVLEAPIHKLGEYTIPVKLSSTVEAGIKVKVVKS